jgi:hypothetical protein
VNWPALRQVGSEDTGRHERDWVDWVLRRGDTIDGKWKSRSDEDAAESSTSWRYKPKQADGDPWGRIEEDGMGVERMIKGTRVVGNRIIQGKWNGNRVGRQLWATEWAFFPLANRTCRSNAAQWGLLVAPPSLSCA